MTHIICYSSTPYTKAARLETTWMFYSRKERYCYHSNCAVLQYNVVKRCFRPIYEVFCVKQAGALQYTAPSLGWDQNLKYRYRTKQKWLILCHGLKKAAGLDEIPHGLRHQACSSCVRNLQQQSEGRECTIAMEMRRHKATAQSATTEAHSQRPAANISDAGIF